MNFHRILSATGQLKRSSELIRCFRDFNDPLAVSLAFTTLGSIHYPHRIVYKGRHRLEITCWEDLTTAWVVLLGKEYRILPEDRIILDLGANIGVFAIFANACNPNATVYSVEPFPSTFELLEKTLDSNQLLGRVHPRNLAIAGESGEVDFDASPVTPSHSRQISSEPGIHSIQVPALTLEDFLNMEGIAEADFIKIDIEGAEYDVILTSSVTTLRRSKRYGIEYHHKGLAPIAAHMAQAGFEITYEPKSGPSGVVEFSRSPL